MAKKRLTVAKTHKRIAKLNKKCKSIIDDLSELRNLSVRGKKLADMDKNYILYNIAMFKTMIQECNDMYPEGPVRDQLISETVGKDIHEKMDKMRHYITLSYERDDLNERVYKLEDYVASLPRAERDAYKLEQTAENVDERDLGEDDGENN